MKERMRIVGPIILILILASVSVWYLWQGRQEANSGVLEASGTVEAGEVSISSEMAGRVAEVIVGKGELVQEGDVLLRLDDELMQSQRKRALAALEAAQANLVTAQSGVEAAQAALDGAQSGLEVANANSEAERLSVQNALDDLYDSAELAKAQAMADVSAAHRVLREATYLLDNYTVPSNQVDLTPLEGVTLMKERLDLARQAYEPYEDYPSGDPTRDDLKEALDEAQSDYNSAVRRLELEVAVEQAQASLDLALENLDRLSDGPDPDAVAVLEARLEAIAIAPSQAEAVVEQARVGLDQAQALHMQAEKTIAQAEAELQVIDIQLKKLVVYAPTDGIILSHNVAQGEIIMAGAPVMVIGRLDSLTITVYVPEDRYGQIRLGGEAQVRVDSFPGEVFTGTVVHIADQAEFTPRNVQTAEGRRTTVFAIELAIQNLDGKLKPGMPADVTFVD